MDGIYFFKGNDNTLQKKDATPKKDPLKDLKDTFTKVLDGKNLSFLLGCGCSSHYEGKVEVGIPTMQVLAKNFFNDPANKTDLEWIKANLSLDTTKSPFATNLEAFLGTLHSLYFFYERTGQTGIEHAQKVDQIIKKVRNYLLKCCINEEKRNEGEDKALIEIYERFYRKLLFRNANLPKTNIFTTNYDLYSEIALDKLGIHYVNGFSGGIKRYFNPTIFNYALAEKMDLSQSKWSVIDNFIYLYKLHGSLNWIQDEEHSKLFRVREIQEVSFEILKEKNVVMIHPTPLKYNASLGTPYSDLFREFQRKLMQTNNVLITLGYSFNDEHINNLIYQAFTIPSFRLIVLGDVNANEQFKALQALNDPRIWIIGGELDSGAKLHYFKQFVEDIMPDLSNDDIDKKLETTFLELLKKSGNE